MEGKKGGSCRIRVLINNNRVPRNWVNNNKHKRHTHHNIKHSMRWQYEWIYHYDNEPPDRHTAHFHSFSRQPSPTHRQPGTPTHLYPEVKTPYKWNDIPYSHFNPSNHKRTKYTYPANRTTDQQKLNWHFTLSIQNPRRPVSQAPYSILQSLRVSRSRRSK